MVKHSYLIPLGLLVLILALFNIDPAEDAHILFRYAQNLSQGHGIVWNVGQDPVEGATSFLWTVILAGAGFIGYSIPSAAQLLGFLFSALAVFLVWKNQWSWIPAAVLALSPLTIQYLSGFETPLYTFLIILWIWRLEKKDYRWMAVISVLMGMTRPEGVVLAGLMWLTELKHWRVWYKDLLLYAVLPGAVYFVWRWMYFGYPLPNTFYVKVADDLINWKGFDQYWPFVLVAGFFTLQSRRPALSKVLFFSSFMYLTIEQWQNIGWRFQYPVLGGLLYLWWPKWNWKMMTATTVVTLTMLVSYLDFVPDAENKSQHGLHLFGHMIRSGKDSPSDERYEIGQRLRRYWDEDNTRLWMISTEAGWLPYYSEWNVIDPVGLNDEYIAHNGLTFEYLDKHRPDVIMFHVYADSVKLDWARGDKFWNEVTHKLYEYAITRGYQLAAISNISTDCRWWYVSPRVNPEMILQMCSANYPYVKSAIRIRGER